MRNGLLFFLFVVFSAPLFSQQLGVTGSVLAFIPRYENLSYHYNPQNSQHLQHKKNIIWPGVRLELNHFETGRKFPFVSYLGFSITYLIPKLDSSSYYLRRTDGGELFVRRGVQRNSMFNFAFKLGLEIPQNLSDFLMIHICLGGGILSSRTMYLMPENTQYSTYNKEDFAQDTFGPWWNATVNSELFAGAVYEFEKYSIVGQYSFLYGVNSLYGTGALLDTRIRNQVSIGIFYPLNK